MAVSPSGANDATRSASPAGGGKAWSETRNLSHHARSSETPAVGRGIPAPVASASSGVMVNRRARAWTVSFSAAPSICRRPVIMHTSVGASTVAVTWSGTVPVQPGGVNRYVPAFVPVARLPT